MTSNTSIARHIEVQVESREFLGIIMENNVSFKEQIDQVCKKLSRSAGIMYRVSNIVSASILRKVYFAIFYPYLCYAVTVWGGSGAVNCAKVTRVHRRAQAATNCGSLSPPL